MCLVSVEAGGAKGGGGGGGSRWPLGYSSCLPVLLGGARLDWASGKQVARGSEVVYAMEVGFRPAIG